jgi:hypothetical protein
MDRVEIYQVSGGSLVKYLALMAYRPRNRRIAEEKYDTAAADIPQSPDKDLDAKGSTFDRVVSVGGESRQWGV